MGSPAMHSPAAAAHPARGCLRSRWSAAGTRRPEGAEAGRVRARTVGAHIEGVGRVVGVLAGLARPVNREDGMPRLAALRAGRPRPGRPGARAPVAGARARARPGGPRTAAAGGRPKVAALSGSAWPRTHERPRGSRRVLRARARRRLTQGSPAEGLAAGSACAGECWRRAPGIHALGPRTLKGLERTLRGPLHQALGRGAW